MQQKHVDLRFRQEACALNTTRSQTERGFAYERVAMQGSPAFDYRWEGNGAYLAYHDLVIGDGEIGLSGPLEAAMQDVRDRLTFAPKGTEITGWSACRERTNTFTTLVFDPSIISEELEDERAVLDRGPRVHFRDRDLGLTLGKIGTLLEGGERVEPMLLETLGIVAVLELSRLPQSSTSGQLSVRQLGLVTEYIDASFRKPISLDDLAGLAGLSRFHFSRAFARSTGRSPMAYVRERRLEEAKALLRDTEHTLDEIAARVGFRAAGSFTQAFARSVGMTPSTYRRRSLP
jgi:AraC family transcriptional regulator